jgi:hypothetical protein
VAVGSCPNLLAALGGMGKAARPALDAVDRAAAYRDEYIARCAAEPAARIRAAG